MRGYDEWRTSGMYSKSLIDVTCASCGEVTAVTAETEFGATDWTPAECSSCRKEFDDNDAWEDAEPPEREPDDWYD